MPAPAASELGFRIVTRAGLAFDNRIAQFISDKLGGDWLATKLARRQLDGLLGSHVLKRALDVCHC